MTDAREADVLTTAERESRTGEKSAWQSKDEEGSLILSQSGDLLRGLDDGRAHRLKRMGDHVDGARIDELER